MARKSKPAAKRSQQAEPDHPSTILVLLAGVAAMLVLGGAGYGLYRADSHARSVMAEAPIELRVDWPIRPTTNGGHVLDELVRTELESQLLALLHHEAEPFNGQSLQSAGEWLSESGWFAGTPTVRRVGQSSVSIDGSWRTPVALVRYGYGSFARDYLIDANLRVLPKVYAVAERTGPFITGVTNAPVGHPPHAMDLTEPWPDQSLAEGLELLLLLLGQPYASQVAGIDVSHYFVEHKLEIITDRGTRVVWGGPVGEFVPGEADTQRKLTHLLQFFNDPAYGRRIDAGLDRLEVFDQRVLIDRTGG